MKRILILLLFPILFVACEQEKPAPIDMRKMQHVMADIHLAETYSAMLDDSTHQAKNKNIDSLAAFYKEIFAHHKVSEQQFRESIEWYRNHPADLDTVYKRMIDDLARLETALVPPVTPAVQ